MSGTGDVLGLALSPPISTGYRRLLISGRKSAMSVVLDKRNSPVFRAFRPISARIAGLCFANRARARSNSDRMLSAPRWDNFLPGLCLALPSP